MYRDGKMLGLSPSIRISISSKSGHSTFVLSIININNNNNNNKKLVPCGTDG